MISFARNQTRARIDEQVREFVTEMIEQQLVLSLGNESRKLRHALYPDPDPPSNPFDRIDTLGLTVGFGALVALLYPICGLASATWSWLNGTL